MQEFHTLRLTYYNASAELFAEQAIAEESGPCSTTEQQSRKEESRAKLAGSSVSDAFHENGDTHEGKEVGKWTSILAH